MNSNIWIAWVLVAFALGAIALTTLGERRWTKTVQGWRDRLERGRVGDRRSPASLPLRYHAQELQGLPAPVQRYFRAVLQEGQPIIGAVSLDVEGRFNLSPTGEQWRPFTSRQRVTTRRPGFLWDARIAVMPGLTVRVVDSYIQGQGLLRAKLQGLLGLAEAQGEGDIARGEFMRWFAEAPWYPTALLPSQGVHWEAVDENSAQATVADGPLTLSLLFRFDDAGLIRSLRAESRGSMIGEKLVMAPWEGKWSNYQMREGVLIPLTGEVAWMRPEGRRPYFVGTVISLYYELALPAGVPATSSDDAPVALAWRAYRPVRRSIQ